MTPKDQPDLAHLENRLLEERGQTLRNMQTAEAEESEGQRESTGELSRVPQHMADVGSDTQEAEKDFANITRESEQLVEIDEALRLLRRDPEAYLTCERCGRQIEPERLETIPWTRLCAADAKREEAAKS
jgi:RNA polymerase-binding transcription factor DksA